VLVHSRLNSMVQTYIFNDNVTNPSTLVSSSNPTLLNLAIDAPGVTTQLHMEPLQFQHDTRSETQGPGRTYAAQETRFYKMFALQSELSVHEATMYAHGAMHSKIDPIGWSTVYRMRREVRSVNHIEELDDFLTTAGLQALDKPTSKLALQAPIWTQSLNTTRRTTDHSRLYDALTRKEGEIATTVDVPVVARELRHFLVNDGGASSLPLGTLMDIVGLDIEVSDIDEASAALQDLIATEDPDATTEVRSIASSKMMHLGESEGPVTIASLYDAILQHWVAPLPTNVPRRVRLQKERLARRIAADVILACLRMRQREEPEGALESLSQPALSQDSGVAFSRRNPGTPEAASQPLPSFSQLSLQSSQPQSSSQQSPLVYTPPVDPLARLRKHLNFRDDAVSPVISSSVRQVLAHWQLGTDPATYDWAATERALHNDNLDQASQEQMEKVRKKKERRERKQKQQDSLVQLRASSQPFVFPKPAVPYPRSSPGPALGGMASSSQVPLPQSAIGISSQPEFAPQSQVEPGKFGGRLDKKKKKRLGGF
jgi:RNA polymerase I-specific transcription initiation factor RRN6